MAKQAKASKFWTDDEPSWLTERVRERTRDIDFSDLHKKLQGIADVLEPIALPDDEEWEFILYMTSIGDPWPHETPFWWFHDYPSSNKFRERAKEFNKEFEHTGVRQLRDNKSVKDWCEVSVLLRAIEEKRLSSAFIDAWAQLNSLLGRLVELRESQPSAKAHRKNVRSAGRNSTIGQHVWYARWVVKYAPDLNDDRAAADDGIKRLCGEIGSGSRGLPQESKWNRNWFRKLLAKPERGGTKYAGSERGLADRLTRMDVDKLMRLARHKWITDDLLPPLDVDAYPRTKRTSSSHP